MAKRSRQRGRQSRVTDSTGGPEGNRSSRTAAKRSKSATGPGIRKSARSKGAKKGSDRLDEVETARAQFLSAGRAAMGVTGAEEVPALGEAIERSGIGWYPLVALGLLVIVDEFQGVAFGILGPEISRALGVSKSGLAAMVAVKTLMISLAMLPMAAYVQKRARRGVVAIVMAFGWSVLTLMTGFVRNASQMLGVLVADGLTTGSVRAVHTPLLIDTYPPEVRVRGLSFYRGADHVGNVVAPLSVGALTALFGFTWRGVFLVMGLVSLIAAVASLRLRDPGFGRWDTSRVREVVRRRTDREDARLSEDDVELGFFEITRRLLVIPTIRRVLAAHAVVGMMIVPLATFMAFFLEERWNMGPGARSLFSAGTPLFAIAALSLFGRWGESLFRSDPARLVRAASIFFAAGTIALPLAILSPLLPLMFILFGASSALFAILGPAFQIAIQGIIPPRMRPHAAALSGIFLAAVGGLGGLVLLGSIDRRFGTGVAIGSLAVPGLLASLIVYSCARTINEDLDRMVGEVIEEEELRLLASGGVRLPMLACRHIDFSYGQLQVLFDLDFAVEDGEAVALLGTNGAGKSTLLRVISGLGLPSRGSVRLRGADITFLDAERRVKLGISQVPGGRAIFGPLSVVDNLRAYGYMYGVDRARVERGVEEALNAFPALGERRNQLASTLSGGEQQMLALAKVNIAQPQLLLIDELTLGLAPRIVSELLEMVRRINAEGTAVVLVEQSVNIALSVVEHAYFMEKGEMRFDGRASELIRREDLLRSVFLQGAREGLKSIAKSANQARSR